MSYMTISSQEKHHFSIFSYFHAHPTTLLLKILGGPMPSPHLKFLGGPSPPSPPRSPPLLLLLLLLWPLLPTPSSLYILDFSYFPSTPASEFSSCLIILYSSFSLDAYSLLFPILPPHSVLLLLPRSSWLIPGLTFPDFDLAPKRNEKFGYCGLDLV